MLEYGVYAHYKGGKYRVLFIADDSTNARSGGRVVIYLSLSYGTIYTRDLEEFIEPVTWPDGSVGPRFAFVGPHLPK